MSVRQKCVQVLQQVIEEKVFFNTLKNDFDAKDLSFANMLILNTLRRFNPLQQMINNYLNKPLPASQKILNYVMICGAAEILLMDTPDYAALNEYVQIAKKLTNRFAGGMVNAILRKIVADKQSLSSKLEKNLMPKTFQHIFKSDYPSEILQNCEKQILQIPPLDISVKSEPEEWAKKMNGVLFANGTIRIYDTKSKISNLEGYSEGAWWVQDLAASLPVRLLGDVRGLKVLDLCAAPGGKTAQLLAAGAKVTAVDIDNNRLNRLQENISRLGLNENLHTYTADGLAFLNRHEECFDIIVLDVPCSATGTFRRHPEVLHIKMQEDVLKQLPVQEKMLNTAVKRLNQNGRILYCTCSLAKAEGENQINKFLEKHNDFYISKTDERCFNLYQGIKFDKQLFDNGVLRTLPYYHQDKGGMDAFFAVCLARKIKEEK